MIGCIASCLLIILNSGLLGITAIIFIIGMVIRNDASFFDHSAMLLEKTLQDTAKDMGVQLNSTHTVSLYDFQVPLATFLIVIAVLIGLIAVFGLFGVIFRKAEVLKVYLTILIIMFLFQFTTLSYIASGSFGFLDRTLRKYFLRTLDQYKGIQSEDINSLTWNAVMAHGECCGVYDFHDFIGLSQWPPQTNSKQLIPLVCCKDKHPFNNDCVYKPRKENTYMLTGCYDKIFSIVFNNAWLKGLTVALLLPQLLIIVAVAWMIFTITGLDDQVSWFC